MEPIDVALLYLLSFANEKPREEFRHLVETDNDEFRKKDRSMLTTPTPTLSKKIDF